MAHVSKQSLQNQLDNAVLGDAGQRRTGRAANASLIDSLYTIETAAGLTVSESGIVNLQTIQPAKSYIEEITVVTTAEASLDESDLGFKVGTSEGGEQIIAMSGATTASLGDSVTAVTEGTGSSTTTLLTTALGGTATPTMVQHSVYTSTERTIHTQISCSTVTKLFDTNTGEFTVAVKYVKL
jgi:hypothetical protein